MFAEAVHHQQQNQLNDAARAYKRLLLLKPDHAQASNNLGCVLQAQGKLSEASARFAQALTLMPQLFDQFQGVCATLVAVLPPLGEAVRKTIAAWPKRLPADQLLGSAGLAAIAGDPLLLCLLQSVPVRDVALERTLTSLRAALLAGAGERIEAARARVLLRAGETVLHQRICIRDHAGRGRAGRAAQSRARRCDRSGRHISPMQLAAFAMYRPLHALPNADALLAKPGRRRSPTC